MTKCPRYGKEGPMKLFYALLLTARLLTAAEIEGKWNLERTFVPVGFDDNDDMVFTVSGTFPNICYTVANTRTTVTPGQQILVFQTAVVPDHFNVNCRS